MAESEFSPGKSPEVAVLDPIAQPEASDKPSAEPVSEQPKDGPQPVSAGLLQHGPVIWKRRGNIEASLVERASELEAAPKCTISEKP